MSNNNSLMAWIDARFPLTKMMEEHMTKYYAPKNFNFWYMFGILATVVLVIQIVSGIFLTMHYKPDAALAFGSVEYIMRDVPGGWFIRYMHSTGASAFFLVVYLHMYRGLMYGSFKQPRELIWIFGVLIYLALMAEAFMGYLLPWGQMSYWGAQVIVNLFAAVPFVGEELSVWIRGDFVISDATLNRFFAFHVIALPLILIGLVVAHIIALHEVGSNNPDGVEIKKNKGPDGIPLDGIPFHPYYTVKDLMLVVVFLMVFFAVVFFAPEMGGFFIEHPNFEPANPLKTPEHIAPVWYFTPYYAMLRAVPPMFGSQFPGVVVMFGAIAVFFFLPWLERSPVKSIRYKGMLSKTAILIFAAWFIVLGYLGVKPSSPDYTMLAQVGTLLYFAYFFFMPVFSSAEVKKTTVRMIGSAVSVLATIGMIYYWFNADGASMAMTLFASIATIAFLIIYLIIPAFYKAESIKPVPERVTDK
ncbi:MAG: cytochrome bc complex cytochrome b subunit [Gammaproteobacteria bacterium]|nr:cytochrome bc complex cytochrome b subunit [Gammaproteobacteria bacterium]